MAIFPDLSEEAQTIMEACINSIPARTTSFLQRTITLDAIEMRIGHKPSEEVMHEIVSAGWLRKLIGDTYYVVEFNTI